MHNPVRAFWLFAGSVFLLMGVLIVFIVLLKLDSLHKDDQIRETARNAAIQAKQTEHQSQRTLNALCSFRQDLQARHDNGVQYYNRHPEVFTRLGISKGQARKQLADQQRVLNSLGGLQCSRQDH